MVVLVWDVTYGRGIPSSFFLSAQILRIPDRSGLILADRMIDEKDDALEISQAM